MNWSVLTQPLAFAFQNLPAQRRARGLNPRKWMFTLNLSFLTPAKHSCPLETVINFQISLSSLPSSGEHVWSLKQLQKPVRDASKQAWVLPQSRAVAERASPPAHAPGSQTQLPFRITHERTQSAGIMIASCSIHIQYLVENSMSCG